MKVLMISGDVRMLEPGSDAAKRLALQKSAVDQLDVFVWPGVHSALGVLRAVRGCDVVTTQDPFWRGLLGFVAARTSGARLNVQVHADLAGQPLWRAWLAQFVLKQADSVRVVSERVRRALPPTKAQVSVLPIYIDLAPFGNIVRRPHPQFAKTILWIGRFEAEKDPLQALVILDSVRRAGVDAGLCMLGEGSLEETLRAQARRAELPVEFPGWQQPGDFLAMADVVLSTSKHESYGASIIEALTAGVPVVSLDVGVAKEAGAIVVPQNQLKEAVLEVLRGGGVGVLKLSLPSAEVWAQEWKKTLQ